MSWFSWAWLIWVLFFVIVEGIALFRPALGDTFSEHWWKVFRLHAHIPMPLRAALVAVQVAAGVWLVGHLVFGLWTL